MQTRIETAEVNSTLENSIAGIRTSKAFVRTEEYEEEKFEKGNVRFKEAREKAYKVMAEYSSGVNFGLRSFRLCSFNNRWNIYLL